jgi:hypothetical protein
MLAGVAYGNVDEFSHGMLYMQMPIWNVDCAAIVPCLGASQEVQLG